MGYLSLYRKWRPQRFEQVLGQQHVVRTLVHALRSGQVAHAYLFAGPRGTGKTTLARLLAKGLNCQHGPTPEPCNQCPSCQAIMAGHSLDVVEIDGASHRGIDEVRELRERVRYAPAHSSRKVYIIDEVHMLTHEAFNALLKVLEEPPAHVVFIFATTEPHRVPATILSRCQRFDLRRLSVQELAQHLQRVAQAEGIHAEPAALELIARHADGAARDALALLEQCAAYQPDRLDEQAVAQVLGLVGAESLFQLAGAYLQGDVAGGLRLLQQLVEGQGVDSRVLLRDLVEFVREAALRRALQGEARTAGGPAPTGSSLRDQLCSRLAEMAALSRLSRVLAALIEAESLMRWVPDPCLALELQLMKLAEPDSPTPAVRPGGEPAAAAAASGRRERPPAPSPTLASAAGPLPVASGSASPSAAGARASESSPMEPTQSRPGPAAGTGQAEFSLEAVQARWGEVLASLKNQQRRAAARVEALLREGRPVRVEGFTVVVGFPADREFHRSAVEQPQARALVEKVLTRLFGRPVTFRTERLDGEKAGPDLPPPPAPALSVASEPRESPSKETGPSEGGQEREQEREFDPETLQAILRVLGGRLLKELDPDVSGAADQAAPPAGRNGFAQGG